MAVPLLVTAAFVGYAASPPLTPRWIFYRLTQGLPGRPKRGPPPYDTAALERATRYVTPSQSFYVSTRPSRDAYYVLGLARMYLSPAQAVQSPRDADWIVQYGPAPPPRTSDRVISVSRKVTLVRMR